MAQPSLKHQLTLHVVSQQKKLLDAQCDSVTAMTTQGQVTILPGHLPLFTQLTYGELVYRINDREFSVAVSQGFMDVNPDNEITIIVDMATEARAISLQAAEKAMVDAKKTMETSTDKRELVMAEASLKQAMLEIQLAHKSKKSSI